MAYLKINDQEAVVLLGIHPKTEFSMEEIGVILGMSTSQATELLRSAIKKLKVPKTKNHRCKLYDLHSYCNTF